jgi:K+-transporting ATPase c subunit
MRKKRWPWLILIAAMIAAGWTGVASYQNHRLPRPVSEREAEAVAETLLVRKLSGPRYFQVPADGPVEEGGPWIEEADAWSQVPRIAAERQMDRETTRLVERLIDRMAEAHPHRMVGGMRIHLPRLNLSLDEINNKNAR